jgi:replication-associated recombination protein RarA
VPLLFLIFGVTIMKCEEKYAPKNLDEALYPSKAVERRIMAYATKQLEGHILLWGPNGTSKSTIANLLPYAMDGDSAIVEDKHFDEILGQKNLKDYLRNACAWGNFTHGKPKFYLVFHEFDNNSEKLHKLWTAMDDLGDTLMVIITTNEPMSIHKSVRSRCTLINLPAITAKAFLPRAQQILQAEGLILPNYQVEYHLSQWEQFSDLRKYLACLDELLFMNNSGLPIPTAPQPTKPSLSIVEKKA